MAPKAPAKAAAKVAPKAPAKAKANAPEAKKEPEQEPELFGSAEVPFKESDAHAAYDAGNCYGLETYLKKYFARTSKCFLFKNPHKNVELHSAAEVCNMFTYKYGGANKVSPSAIIKAFDFVTIVNDPTKPQTYKEHGQTHINMFEGWLHEDTKIPPKPAELKLIQPFLNHIKTVWASGDEFVYQFVMRWFARIAQKQKNVIGLYLMSEQGTGKSAPFEIMLKYVFGEAVGLMTDNPDTITGFNSELAGKMMVVLEEMPTATNSEYRALSNRLKMLITYAELQIREKFEKNTHVKNILSTGVCANRKALMLESSDRRWLKLDIDAKHTGDAKYFKALYEPFEKHGAGKVMWAYLQTMDLCGHDDRKPPMTPKIDTTPRFTMDEFAAMFVASVNAGIAEGERKKQMHMCAAREMAELFHKGDPQPKGAAEKSTWTP